MELRAPGKVNFGLRIVGRRPDGHHRLESLFLPISLADALTISWRDGPGVALEMSGEHAGVPADARNLAVRAAEAFLAATGQRRGVAIGLVKRVPSPGGLAGGSSDAGAVLRGLDALLPGALSAEPLRALALALGADVPFFLDPRPARVSGIGDVIEPLPRVPAFALLLAHPGVQLATAAVYAEYDRGAASLTPPGAGPSIGALLALREEAGSSGDSRETALRSLLVNDLEPAATRLCPAVAELRKEIEAAGALAASLSGSGPTVFGVFPSERAAVEAERRVTRRPGLRTWVVETAPSAGRLAPGSAGA